MISAADIAGVNFEVGWLEGAHEDELQLIRGAVKRNQLTGSESFIVHVERLIGERILHVAAEGQLRENRSVLLDEFVT